MPRESAPIPSVTVSLTCKPVVVRWARFKLAVNEPVWLELSEKVMPAPSLAMLQVKLAQLRFANVPVISDPDESDTPQLNWRVAGVPPMPVARKKFSAQLKVPPPKLTFKGCNPPPGVPTVAGVKWNCRFPVDCEPHIVPGESGECPCHRPGFCLLADQPRRSLPPSGASLFLFGLLRQNA
jgi:hypothetical protein